MNPDIKPDFVQLILAELKKNSGYVSGEELAARLQISRQALWKHIAKLESLGYKITAVPHSGYRLTSIPDRLYPQEIYFQSAAKTIGQEIHYYDAVASTQDECWHLGQHGAGEGTLVVSETQTHGRGRLSRAWLSSFGGAYFSFLLRPEHLTLTQAPKLTLLISLAVLKGVERAGGVTAALKWPNDIFVSGKKLAGILCEVSAEMDRLHFVVCGVGINVNTRDLPATATSLFLQKKTKFDRVAVLAAVLEEIEKYYFLSRAKGFVPILEEWQARCFMWGKEVEVKILDKTITGKAVGLDAQGFLRIKTGTRIVTVSSGDVTKVNPA